MKKLLSLGFIFLFSATFIFAAPKSKAIQNNDGSISIKNVDKDASVKENQKIDEFKGVTVITGSKVKKANPITIDLSEFGNKEIQINLTCDIKIVNSASTDDIDVVWMINDVAAKLPKIAQEKVAVNTWTTVKGELFIPLNENKSLYLSGAGFPTSTSVIYIKNLDVKITGDEIGSGENASAEQAPVSWLDAPSIYEAYKDDFDYFGLACTLRGELNTIEGPEGISHHANCITMGNELKPDFLFNWQNFNQTVDFVAEDGKTYQMPYGLPYFNNLNLILKICKMYNLQLRGHVLVWHSQTPDWFFKEDFGKNNNNNLVDKETMTARQEWYIKSVLEYVNDWEAKNNKGQHIITTWDVVNEACSDSAGDIKYLREDSNWYRIYKDDTFIINAFRYANKYAPSDVLLCYNDYNCYQSGKTRAICKVIDSIRATPDARVDVVGMQSHISVNYPGINSFETAIKTFLAKDIDIQITELDIANGNQKYSPIQLKSTYKQYFKLFKKYKKTEGNYGIRGVTIWGLEDSSTWLNSQDQYKGHTQYPLLFNKDFTCKPAFYGVLEAAE